VLEALSKQMVWTVYFEVTADCTFEEAAYTMDIIQSLEQRSSWLTPKTREALAGKAGQHCRSRQCRVHFAIASFARARRKEDSGVAYDSALDASILG